MATKPRNASQACGSQLPYLAKYVRTRESYG